MDRCNNCNNHSGLFESFDTCDMSDCPKCFCDACSETCLTECPKCNNLYCSEHLSNHKCEEVTEDEEVFKFYSKDKSLIVLDVYSVPSNSVKDELEQICLIESEGYSLDKVYSVDGNSRLIFRKVLK